MRWITVLACVAGLAAVQFPAAQAAEREGSMETRFGFVYQNSSDADFDGGTTAEFDSDTGFKFGFAYHYTDNLELALNLGIGQRDYDARIAVADEEGEPTGTFFGVSGDLDYTTVMVDATWNFLSGPFTPFVSGGIGWTWVDTNVATEPPEAVCWWDPWWGYVCADVTDTKTLDGFSYELAAGARYDFSETVVLLGSYRINWIDFDHADGTPDFDGFELSFGWKF